jgi:hypothetical protein
MSIFCATGEQKNNEEATLLELTTSNRFGDANGLSNDGKKGRDLKVFTFASIVPQTTFLLKINLDKVVLVRYTR